MLTYVIITWKKLLLKEQITVFSTDYMMDSENTTSSRVFLKDTKVGMINQIADNNGKRIPYDDNIKKYFHMRYVQTKRDLTTNPWTFEMSSIPITGCTADHFYGNERALKLIDNPNFSTDLFLCPELEALNNVTLMGTDDDFVSESFAF